MDKEIKEILDKFDKVLENYELDKKFGQMSVDSICHLFPSEMIIIKNYITNLQEENKRLNNIINELEKWLKDNENNKIHYDYENKYEYIYVDELLNKLKELIEGEDNE